jgi:hypothetical protein
MFACVFTHRRDQDRVHAHLDLKGRFQLPPRSDTPCTPGLPLQLRVKQLAAKGCQRETLTHRGLRQPSCVLEPPRAAEIIASRQCTETAIECMRSQGMHGWSPAIIIVSNTRPGEIRHFTPGLPLQLRGKQPVSKRYALLVVTCRLSCPTCMINLSRPPRGTASRQAPAIARRSSIVRLGH